MSLSSCSSLGYLYEKSFCLPVGIDVKQDEFTADSAWIAGAFFLGLILGAGIILLCARPFLVSWRKKKARDNLLPSIRPVGVVHAETANGWVTKSSPLKKDSNDKKEEKKFVKVRFWRKKKNPAAQKYEEKKAREEDVDPALAHGMFDILLPANRSESEVAMAEQEMAAVISIERSKVEEKSILMVHTLDNLLRKKVKKRALTKTFLQNFMKKTKEDIQDMTKMIDREREEDEEKLRSDQKLSKDIQTLETELQKLHAHYSNKQSKLQRDFQNKIRQDLLRLSGMSEAEINDIMAKLINNMAVVEEKIGLEQVRQIRDLEQRLARRRQVLDYREMEAAENERDIDIKVETLRNLLPAHMEGSLKIERHSDNIVNEFANDLDCIRKYNAKEFAELTKQKYDSLLNTRLMSFTKLVKKQETERGELLLKEGQAMNTINFITKYHDLISKHHVEREVLCVELDKKEVQEIHKLKQDLTNKEKKEMDIEVKKAVEKLEAENSSISFEAKKIFELYKAEMENYNVKNQKERQAKLTQLQERLQKKLNTADENEARNQKEQEILKEEQMATLSAVLTTNMDLTEEDKERVLKEYEQNMLALSNQLLCSKLRQQKSFEIKLSQRKSQLEKLQLKKKDMQRSTKLNEDEKKNLLTKLSAEIAKEEELFEDARRAAVAELRRQLAKETEESLKLQDEEIGLLIGRLQVSKARRKAVLEKQSTALKQLQEDLERRLSSGEPLPPSETDQIVSQHNTHVAHLNEELQRHREREERIIKEKLNAKKRHREQEIKSQLEDNAQLEYTDQQRRGAGYARLALVQIFLKQSHAKEIQKLNAEMLADFEKSKRDLNFELELELQKELEIQNQALITEIAAMSKMSKQDLQAAVSAVTSGNVDNKDAQQLVKEIRGIMARTAKD